MHNELLVRELKIMREIAKQHNLLPLFEELMKTTKRKVVREKPVYGFVLTHSIRFNGHEIGIENIFDAALAVNFINRFNQKISMREFWQLLKNEVKVLTRTRKYKVESLPVIDD